MPQQINLCTSVLRPQRQRFDARTLLLVMGAIVVVGGVLTASWVWSLEGSSVAYRQTLDTQAGEIKILQTAIERSRASAAPADPALLQQIQQRRAEIAQREKTLDQLQLGMLHPGEGHSDRLLMVARTVPPAAWVSGVKVDVNLFEVSGFTLDPEAINVWVAQLGVHPLMRNLKLAAVRVESSTVGQAVPTVVVPTTPASAGSAPTPASNKLWSFGLVSLEPAAITPPSSKRGTP